MLERGEGRIVNVASMSGFDVNVPQKQASYNTTKAGIRILTKSLAVERADRGVRVNAVAPGYMRTDLVDEVLEANPEMAETWLENTPMDGWVDPRNSASGSDRFGTAASRSVGKNSERER